MNIPEQFINRPVSASPYLLVARASGIPFEGVGRLVTCFQVFLRQEVIDG